MKQLMFFSFILCSVLVHSQITNYKYTNSDFGWTMMIPSGFETVEGEEWERMRTKGAMAIEETFDTDVSEAIEATKVLFVIKKGDFNYLEVCKQNFDETKDGDYAEHITLLKEVLEETFSQQLPGTKSTSRISKIKIDNKEFYLMNLELFMGNKSLFVLNSYSRLIKGKDLTVNIMYVDKAIGNIMIETFSASKFEK